MAKDSFRLSDLGRVQWLPTIKLAIGRGVASGLVITLLMLMGGGLKDAGPGGAIGFLLMWGLTSFIGAPGVALMIRAINAVFLGMGLGIAVLAGNLILLMLSLAIACGDPIIYLVNRRWPNVFEVADFKPFNMQLTIFVLDDGLHVSRAAQKDFL